MALFRRRLQLNHRWTRQPRPSASDHWSSVRETRFARETPRRPASLSPVWESASVSTASRTPWNAIMSKRSGSGWAACYLKVGMLRSQDASSAVVELKQDGSIVVRVGSVEVGAGTTTVAAQIAAEELGVDPEVVTVVFGDTETTPYDGGTVGSRSTHIMGNAVRAAAREVRDALYQTAAEELDVAPGELEARDGFVRVRGAQDRGLSIADLAFLTL